MRSRAPIHSSISGLTGFFTKTGTSTPRSESAKACTAKGLAVVRAPTQRMSMSYFRASSTCSGVATSVAMSMWVSSFTCFIQGSAFSPWPSKPPGLVRGFHTPARKLWQPFMASSRAVSITCSSVSALHGPAITKGRSLSLGKFNGCKSNSIKTLPPAPPYMEGSRMFVGEYSTDIILIYDFSAVRSNHSLPHREGGGRVFFIRSNACCIFSSLAHSEMRM